MSQIRRSELFVDEADTAQAVRVEVSGYYVSLTQSRAGEAGLDRVLLSPRQWRMVQRFVRDARKPKTRKKVA